MWCFPWLHSHGPIEADLCPAGCRTKADFRGYTATAPLKPAGAVLSIQPDLHFRGYTATAPLKPRILADLTAGRVISVATQPRPH